MGCSLSSSIAYVFYIKETRERGSMKKLAQMRRDSFDMGTWSGFTEDGYL